MNDLTDRQREYLVWIINYRAKSGVSPSVRMAASYFGVSNTSAHEVIKALVEKRFLQKVGGSRQTGLIPGERFLELEGLK